ncbi:hypothetical protein BABINDRAFT_127786 [Babjeviella inositovora NRRL Y-12698]|uniref:Uncharacterized protein n=1 Tax=Babjeviella inositovora NRRL Y-12698 TaxID=984486 RepID=A0A1E3QT03_9ASCO|nr:uncharacterized protein BABINDRAFT_127786 [Babjeviella inositovora NRRL Y-12698]ODQ80835.1 hypothetical protein BABINDRAFT_127786 [Babjeviella inositovora NRRL Y-12698]
MWRARGLERRVVWPGGLSETAQTPRISTIFSSPNGEKGKTMNIHELLPYDFRILSENLRHDCGTIKCDLLV